MINDYWLDFIKEMRQYWSINKFILMYLQANDGKGKIPSVHFWAILFLFLQMVRNRIKIVFPLGCLIITPQDAFNEMEDCYLKELPIFRRIKYKIIKWWKGIK